MSQFSIFMRILNLEILIHLQGFKFVHMTAFPAGIQTILAPLLSRSLNLAWKALSFQASHDILTMNVARYEVILGMTVTYRLQKPQLY